MHNLERYLTIQMKEVQEHKWYLSEKTGRDIGDHEAVFDWTQYHAERFNKAYINNVMNIDKECNNRCGSACRRMQDCTLTIADIHRLLSD
jgi:hypothetical protein